VCVASQVKTGWKKGADLYDVSHSVSNGPGLEEVKVGGGRRQGPTQGVC
jgi:hypothetical protein